MDKPYSQACENNKAPILAVLTRVFQSSAEVLEIGSGTGQHAVHFASGLPHLRWQASDVETNLAGIRAWFAELAADNRPPPIALDVLDAQWPRGYDAAFSANTLHIMPWAVGSRMIEHVALGLPSDGRLAIYGPFNYAGAYTSASNRDFDGWLKARDPRQGIRDFETVNEHASRFGLQLLEDNPMPANNRLLVWQKV